jgi:hypothetical protein
VLRFQSFAAEALPFVAGGSGRAEVVVEAAGREEEKEEEEGGGLASSSQSHWTMVSPSPSRETSKL